MTPTLHGTCDPAFAPLRQAFAQSFAEGLEIGASVAVVVDGRLVANLWAGQEDPDSVRPWTAETLVNVWSVTKGVVALAMALLVERVKLDYRQTVASVWPEFAAGGKGAITVDQVLSHQAGLEGLTVPMGLADFYRSTPYVQALAAMEPLWEPGSRSVYHAMSYGHLAGEILRRVDGRRIGRFVADEIAAPLQVPFFIGLPEAEDHRAARLAEGPGVSDWVAERLAGPYPHACRNPTLRASEPNDRAWRAAEIPGGNGHGSAAALATIYGAMVRQGDPILRADSLARATAPRFDGLRADTGTRSVWGAGFQMAEAEYGRRADPGSFGHGGWGGSLAFADPRARLGFAYVTNHLCGFADVDPRRTRLIEAVYDAL